VFQNTVLRRVLGSKTECDNGENNIGPYEEPVNVNSSPKRPIIRGEQIKEDVMGGTCSMH
jgi:hypothetical protein